MGETMRSRGMRDMLPDEMERFRRIEQAFRDVCLGWGYREVRTPVVENLYLFTSAGTLSPQMLDRVYSFLDWDGWSGERVVLRPDSTIPAARLFAEEMAGSDDAKLFYVQNVFRFDPSDRSREDWQCGVELLGDTFPAGDIELILMAREVLDRLGVQAEIELSHPGIVRGLLEKAGLTAAEQTAVYDRLLSGDTAALDELGEKLPGSTPPGPLLSTEGSGPDYVDNLRAVFAGIPDIEAALKELGAVSRIIAGMGLDHRIAPLGVRNFEYYTGPVFNLVVGDARLGGGGRYDSLAGLVGGRDVPASGFALEVDLISQRLAAGLTDETPITIRCETADALGRAFELAKALRDQNERVRLVTNGAPGARDIAVSGSGFALATNGAPPREFTDIDQVVAAVAGG